MMLICENTLTWGWIGDTKLVVGQGMNKGLHLRENAYGALLSLTYEACGFGQGMNKGCICCGVRENTLMYVGLKLVVDHGNAFAVV